jgi:hypothetical protein
MEHAIKNNDLNTVLKVDETVSSNVCIKIEGFFDNSNSHYLSIDDLENLIHVLKYVYDKKKSINPNFGRRISGLSIASIEAQKKHNK